MGARENRGREAGEERVESRRGNGWEAGVLRRRELFIKC